MKYSSIQNIYISSLDKIGMQPQGSSPYGIGQYYLGNGVLTEGTFWHYCHADLFGVSICDFHALRDCRMYMPPARYMSLCLSNAGKEHLTSYIEEKGGEAHAILKAGSHVAYVEVLYMAKYYEQYLPLTLQSYPEGITTDIMNVLSIIAQWSASSLQIFRNIKDFSGKGAAAELYFQSEAIKLMALLLQSQRQISEIEKSDLMGITAVIKYISDNLENELTHKELAHISNMSASKLKFTFKNCTGKTLGAYTKAKRMEKAEQLLSDTMMPIEEIAMRVGFHTSAGFVTAFRKHNGYTPGNFRQLMNFHYNPNPSIEYKRSAKTKELSEEWGNKSTQL